MVTFGPFGVVDQHRTGFIVIWLGWESGLNPGLDVSSSPLFLFFSGSCLFLNFLSIFFGPAATCCPACGWMLRQGLALSLLWALVRLCFVAAALRPGASVVDFALSFYQLLLLLSALSFFRGLLLLRS